AARGSEYREHQNQKHQQPRLSMLFQQHIVLSISFQRVLVIYQVFEHAPNAVDGTTLGAT
ncbi:MAG: hypothetical protein VX664_09835, partial [Chloroflexota bacterium]|nr:hypothetical protein [Chloroflexota bacterium]